MASRMAAQKPVLSETNRQDRLRFASDHKAWTGDDCARVMFSDESTFTTRWDQRLRVWLPEHCCYEKLHNILSFIVAKQCVLPKDWHIKFHFSRYNPQFVYNVVASCRTAVNVWGAVSREGLGPLFRIAGSLTSDTYCAIIDYVTIPYALDGPFPDGDFTFQHDLSPIHMSRKVRSLLVGRCVTDLPWHPRKELT